MDIKGLKIVKSIIVIIISLCAVYLSLSYFYLDNRFATVVEDRIYRSSQLTGNDLRKVIREKGIKTIINLRGRWDDENWYEREREVTEIESVKLNDIRISPHDLPEFEKLSSILDVLLNGERPLLIHCERGVDRTGLVSAMALMIEKDPPLSLLKKQFSFRYGVVPFYGSVGPYFFKNYEQWLENTKRMHSKNNFIYWIENGYADNTGNLKYWIDTVNGKGYSKHKFDGYRRFFVKDVKERISIRGWAFDTNKKSPSDGLVYIVLDNKISQRADFRHNMPEVARFFKFGEKYYKDFMVGWEAEFKRENLSDGCHKIYIRHHYCPVVK